MDDASGNLTMEELSRRSEVPIRTIRYYIGQGLLPGPSGRGKGASYHEGHLPRLRLIRRLVERRVPLAEIAEQLRHLSLDDVRALLADEERRTGQVAEAPSPRAYVSALLQQAQSEASSAPPLPPASARVERSEPAGSAPEFAQREELWRHIELVPGVELRVLVDAGQTHHEMVERVLEVAKEYRRRHRRPPGGQA